MKFKFSARGMVFLGTHDEIVRICRASGFKGIEGDPIMFLNEAEENLPRIKEIYESGGVRMASFHLPSGPEDDASSFYETTRRSAVRNIRVWMEKARSLGAFIGILHPTTKGTDASIEGTEKYFSSFAKSLGELIPAAESLGFTLAVENMLLVPGASSSFGAFPEHIRLIRENFACKNLGFCYDSGHALMAGRENASLLLDEMSDYLSAFHLQDNAGDRDSHLAPGRGLVDWNMVFKKIEQISFSGYATVEAPPFAPGPDYGKEAWKNLFEDTVRLYSCSMAGQDL